MKVAVLADSRINLRQDWLHGYELEVYLIMKLIKLGYRPKEVSVSKIYPPRAAGNTKICPFVDWWNLARPIFIVGFGIEHFVNRRIRNVQRPTIAEDSFRPQQHTEPGKTIRNPQFVNPQLSPSDDISSVPTPNQRKSTGRKS